MQNPRHGKILLVVAIAGLTVMAGCSALTDGGPDGTPVGYDVDGDQLNGTELSNSMVDTIESAGSYSLESTTQFTVTQQGTEITTTVENTRRVDFESQQGLRINNQSTVGSPLAQNTSTIVYTDGNASYRRQSAGNQTRYDSQQGSGTGFQRIAPVNVSNFAENYTGPVDGFAWERNGTTQSNGVAVTRYDITDVAQNSSLSGGSNTTIGSVGGFMLVDGDGIIRELSASYTVEQTRTQNQNQNQTQTQTQTSQFEINISISDVGSTTVSEPGWTAQAETTAQTPS